ncbi:hypothetical protein DSO57_1036974 [Entomophthora muscae]|uniref:Uncharacterized protein n=1 Tax=Entomophthora muscae TaxID=34485 RepID=A0ACC2TLI2_9FUNG|nr:hypothetical protein DSO57_1036974 [Entomophthora muscae]
MKDFLAKSLGGEDAFGITYAASATVSGRLVGSLSTNTSMCLVEDLGWADWAPKFTAFHLQPEWYGKDTVKKMKQEMASPSDVRLWAFDQEFYYFAGGIQISEELDCPRQTYCIILANWQRSAWNVERIMFSKQGNRIPLRIAQLIKNITNESTSHYMCIKGPREGKVVFNQISLGLTGERLHRTYIFKANKVIKLAPLFLSSGLPDGIISLE